VADKFLNIGQYGSVDPTFTAVPFAKLDATTRATLATNAASMGMTAAEYYAGRGGVNASGYFGDSWSSSKNLTDAEYSATINQVRAAGQSGVAFGSAINAATAKKQYDEAIKAGVDPAKAATDYNAAVSASNAALNLNVPLMKDAAGKVFSSSNSGTPVNFYGSSSGGGTTTGASTGTTYTGPVLASTIFKNTLGLFFGPEEMAKPWVDELYKVASTYYKTGSTAEEAFNLSVQDARNNPNLTEFTKRFKGIYDLTDLRRSGKPVTVPTIAEYFATQTKMADILKSSNLGELANEEFLGDVIGKGVPASVFAERITQAFDRIDLAPSQVKKTIERFYPNLTRTQLAKAIITGEKGAKELALDIAGYEVLSAAEQQKLGAGNLPGGVTIERASELAAAGETFQSALGKFGRVAEVLPTATKLADISKTTPLTQSQIEDVVFRESAAERQALEALAREEQARYAGKSGTIGSKSFASQARGAGLI
jgi:hypothetical protein